MVRRVQPTVIMAAMVQTDVGKIQPMVINISSMKPSKLFGHRMSQIFMKLCSIA